jgi:ATP-binding cassette, subfamily B (MDR/TAP), member 1
MQGGMGAGQWLSFAPSKYTRRYTLRTFSVSPFPCADRPQDMAQAATAANRIIELRKKETVDGRLVSLDKGDLGNEDGGVQVEFRNVWFRYPTRDVPILNGLSFTVCLDHFCTSDSTGC